MKSILPMLLLIAACKGNKQDLESSEAYAQLQSQVSEKLLENGNILVEVDLNKDGAPDVFNHYRPRENADRLLLKKEADMNHDGSIDVISTFDDLGELTTEEMDRDFDGGIDWRDHYQNGRRVMSETDTNEDGEMDIFSYFQDGKITRKERDTDADGRIDFWERFDEEGNVIKTGADTDGDGKMDFREE